MSCFVPDAIIRWYVILLSIIIYGESLIDGRKNTHDCWVQYRPVKMSNTIEISHQKSTWLEINSFVFIASAETLYYIGSQQRVLVTCQTIATAAAIWYSLSIEEIIQIIQCIFYDPNKTVTYIIRLLTDTIIIWPRRRAAIELFQG